MNRKLFCKQLESETSIGREGRASSANLNLDILGKFKM